MFSQEFATEVYIIIMPKFNHFYVCIIIDFCQLAMRSKVEARSSSEMLGHYSLGNATALISELQSLISYQVVPELCSSSKLHFTGFSFVIINELQSEEVRAKYAIQIHVLIIIICNAANKHLNPELCFEKHKIYQHNCWQNELCNCCYLSATSHLKC